MMEEIKFYRINDPYGFLSNFAPYPIFVNGQGWKTVEHYFQASKFEDEIVRQKIRSLDSPMKAASEGRDRKNNIRADWDGIRNDVMHEALRYKFLQHPALRRELILTGSNKLIEHTQNDEYWADAGDGTGKNMLGILLMKVREELITYSDDPDYLLPPWVAFPGVDSSDMFWRMGLGEDYMMQWAEFYDNTDKDSYKKIFPQPADWDDIYD